MLEFIPLASQTITDRSATRKERSVMYGSGLN
jgi:hypothetical protein